jgi:hypothetical protein
LESWQSGSTRLFGYITYFPSLTKIEAFGDIIAALSQATYAVEGFVPLDSSFRNIGFKQEIV